MALAQRCGLADLAAMHVKIGRPAEVNADVKVGCLVAGMAAGAECIDDIDVLRPGATAHLFGGSGRRPRWGRSCARSPGV
jgi:hypothetical protein